MGKRNVYIAIMHAAAKGNGLRLSPQEVAVLAIDDAIETYAANCLDEEDWLPGVAGKFTKPKPWASINPSKKRKGSNLCV